MSKGNKKVGGEKSPSKSAPKQEDFSEFLEGVSIPKGIKEVAITSDGQVFLPKYIRQARKHSANKKLELQIVKL